MCQLFETIKIGSGEPQNLSLHEKRMNRSRSILFGSSKPLKLSDHITVPEESKDKIYRCRVIYKDAIISTEYSPYIRADVKTFKMVDANSLAYDFKYLDRSLLNSFIDKDVADDVLYIKNGCLTDSSFANVVFTPDGHDWITPDTPLLFGTMRELLLQKGVIKTARLTIKDLSCFTHFRLVNAMLGFDAPLIPVGNIII